jgi:hypothetical protein
LQGRGVMKVKAKRRPPIHQIERVRLRHWARYVLSVTGASADEMDRRLIDAAGLSTRATKRPTFFYRVSTAGQVAKIQGTQFHVLRAIPLIESKLGIHGSEIQYRAPLWEFLQGKTRFSDMSELCQEIDHVLLRLSMVRKPADIAGSSGFILVSQSDHPDFPYADDADWRHLIYRAGLGRLLSPIGIHMLNGDEWRTGRILDQIYVAALLLFEAHLFNSYGIAGSIAEKARDLVSLPNLLPTFGERDAALLVHEFAMGVLNFTLLDARLAAAGSSRKTGLDEIIDPTSCDQCFQEINLKAVGTAEG